MILIFMLFHDVEVAETRRTWHAGDELHDFNYLLARCFDGAVFRVFRHRYDHILVLQARVRLRLRFRRHRPLGVAFNVIPIPALDRIALA
jgi:hypothetical protein